MWNFFSKKAEKEDLAELKKAVQTGFNSVKQDINNTSVWIDHLNTNNTKSKSEILEIKDDLSAIKEELENIKNIISILGEMPAFKQRKTVFDKQTGVDGVLNSVQTTVQTAFLDNLSTTERAIIFVLLNSEMKLSYDDLASMLGKTKSTIRGQINNIKQKSEGLIEETINENNKKRVYIPEKVKEILLKRGKVKIKSKKKEEYN
jgi:predicted transcriptional regulator